MLYMLNSWLDWKEDEKEIYDGIQSRPSGFWHKSLTVIASWTCSCGFMYWPTVGWGHRCDWIKHYNRESHSANPYSKIAVLNFLNDYLALVHTHWAYRKRFRFGSGEWNGYRNSDRSKIRRIYRWSWLLSPAGIKTWSASKASRSWQQKPSIHFLPRSSTPLKVCDITIACWQSAKDPAVSMSG